MIKIKYIDKKFYSQFKDIMYATPGSAGLDLRARTDILVSSAAVRVKTGIALHIEDPTISALILPRSGLGHKGLVLGNSVGLIDSDYQDEIEVSLYSRSGTLFEIQAGDRIAQLVFIPIIQPLFEIVDEFTPSIRSGGFGSTGGI